MRPKTIAHQPIPAMRLFLPLILLLSLPGSLFAQSSDTGNPSDSRPRTVVLGYINDVHAQIEPHPELFWSGGQEHFVRKAGGLARIATVMERLRAEYPEKTLFIDGGDTIQGSGPAAWTEGRVVVEPTNALGLDLGIPGNWSVAYGAGALKERAREFRHPLIAANMFDEATGQPLFAPYLLREINGVKVAVIGFTEPAIPTRQPPHLSEGLAFEGRELLQPLIDEVRGEKQADIVLLATHIGLPKAISLAETLRDVDVVLSSDTHERTYQPIVRGDTWVVEAGAFASFVGILKFQVNNEGLVSRSWRLVELHPDLYPENPRVREATNRALAPHRERMNEVIGHTHDWLARYAVINTSLDNLITDALRHHTGADFALSNGFRFSPPTAPGPITVADLWNWLPLRLELKTGRTTGKVFRQYWEREFENVFSQDPERLFGGWLPRVSGMSVRFNRIEDPPQRLREILVAGEPLQPTASYSVVAGHRRGAPDHRIHRLDHCTHTRLLGHTTHDAVRAYLARFSPIRSTYTQRVRCQATPAALRSQFLDLPH